MPRKTVHHEAVNHPATRAALYLRVSTEEQATDGYGLDVQRSRCTAMAEAKGWQVDARHVYTDEGISGTKDIHQRPGLAAMLDAVKAGDVGAVIVLSLDRLGRKARIVLNLVDGITEAGAELVSCKEALDTSTPAGRFVLGIFAGLAQLERDNIVERTTDGRNQRGKRDGEKGGRVPFGYKRMKDVGSLAVDETAAPLVRTIFAERAGGASLRAIADTLNTQGAPVAQGGSRWYASSVKAVLDNEAAYSGGHRGNSPIAWPRIV